MLIKLSGPRIINLNRVNQIDWTADLRLATITWATGDEPLQLKGEQAIALMDAIEHLSMFPNKRLVDLSFVDPFAMAEERL
jgi:hypothetical protein